MKRITLEAMTVDQLVERFAAIAVDQDQALLHDDIAKYNRLVDQLRAVEEQLKRRPGDQRRTLLPLYEHVNWQVRLMSTHATLAIAPQVARQMLQTIADSRHYPQAGYAGMSLDNLDRGIYKPT
jgi:hypothetical protein